MAALPDCILHRHCSVFPAVYDSNVRIVFAVLCDSRKRMERFGKIGRKRRLHLRDADYSTISLLLLNITVLFEYLPGIVLPSNFATLGAIVSMKPEHEFEMLLKVLVGYGIVDALIIALMSFRVKKMDMQF